MKDQNSRFLLLVSKNSTSQNLIQQIIKKEQKLNSTYIGSPFKGDKNESYTEEVLYKIQTEMKNETILILKSLEIIYPSLYDLFNQNFSEFNGNKCTKITFANNQSTSLINDKFKIIVLIDSQMMQYEDKPFINRFEKHVISFENILLPEYIKIVKNINKKLMDLIIYKNININLKKQLINCDKEVIEKLVFDLTSENSIDNNKSLEDYEKEIFELISPILTQDIISCFNINGFVAKEPLISEIIKESYNKSHVSNITQFLKKLSEQKKELKLRHIIYTFSNIAEPIFNDNEKKIINSISSFSSNNSNDSLDSFFNKQKTIEIVIDSIDKSKDLEFKIEQFYKGKNNLCIIKFEEDELNKVNFVKNIIDDLEKIESMNKDSFKYFLFIVYMKRELFSELKNNTINKKDNSLIKDQIPLGKDFYQITIDNLNEENISYNIFDLISNNENINKVININQIIEENIFDCINKFKLVFKNKKNNFNENIYKEKISEIIKNEEFLCQKINQILVKNCKNVLEIMAEILTNEIKIYNDDKALLAIIDQHLKNEVKSGLKKLFYILETNQILSSYAFNKNIIIYKDIINSFLDNITLNDINLIMKINIILELNIPSIKTNLYRLKKYIKENVLEKYIKNEDMLRTDLPDDNEQKWKNIYKDQKKSLEKNIRTQIYKIKGLEEILKIKNIQAIKDFFNDLYIIYLSDKYKNELTEKIRFLDIIIQIYILNDGNIEANFAEKIFKKHEERIMENKFDDYFNDIAKVLLFLESYSDFIYYIIGIYSNIFKFSPKIESVLIDAFNKEKFIYEKGERAPKYYAEVNAKLYKIYECLIFSMKKILYSFCEEREKLLEYIKFIKSNMIKIGQLNSKFSFFSKEYFIFRNLILFLHSLEKKNNKFDNDDFIKISEFLDNERKYINNDYNNELIENLIKIRNILIKNFGEYTEEYATIFINILLNEYKIFESDQYRLEILKIICSNNKLIKKSIPVLEYLFGNLEPDYIEQDIQENGLICLFTKEYYDNEKYDFINKQKNNTLTQILLYLFEYKIEKFFFKLKNKYYKNEKEKYLKIIFDSCPFIYFKTAVITLQKIQSNKFEEENGYIYLIKLYSFAYIKRYLEHYINLKLEEEYHEDSLKNDPILNFNNNGQNQTNEIQLIKIYMLKIINHKGYNIFKYHLEEKYLNFLKEFIEYYEEEINSNNIKNKNNINILNNVYIFNLRKNCLETKFFNQINEAKNDSIKIDNLIDNFYSLLANQ